MTALAAVFSVAEMASMKISAERLRRPKLNFLYRVVSVVTQKTGFCAGLFDDDDGQLATRAVAGTCTGEAADKTIVRQGKLEYFNRLQLAVAKAFGEEKLTASTRSIITGKDSAGANRLLQVTTACCALSPRLLLAAEAAVPPR